MKLKDILIYEDGNLIALNKPSGMLSVPDRAGKEQSLKELLQEYYPEIFTVHRLDRDTSGLIIFAKNASAHRHFSLQFEQRKTGKWYLGLLLGTPAATEGHIDAPIAENMTKRGSMLVHKRGKPALTDYRILEQLGPYSWAEFRIHTGRTHQIRVHARHLGHPLAVDPLYGDGKVLLLSSIKRKFKLSKGLEQERPLLNRLALHAHRLQITDASDRLMVLEAPLQKDMKVALEQLKKWL
ncbi:RluA family pseudouridine synthase [Niabella terrae]